MIIDFGNRNKGIAFEKLDSIPFVEKLIKQFELKFEDLGNFPRHLTNYAGGNSSVSEREILRALNDIGFSKVFDEDKIIRMINSLSAPVRG